MAAEGGRPRPRPLPRPRGLPGVPLVGETGPDEYDRSGEIRSGDREPTDDEGDEDVVDIRARFCGGGDGDGDDGRFL